MSTPRLVGCAAIITSLLVAFGSTAHAQSFAWARSGGGVDVDEARAVAVDAGGNSYVTGIFSKSLACFICGQPAIFGAGQPNATTLLPDSGTQDIFVAKYDSAGVLQWVRRAGGGGPDEALGIAVDRAGNSYITGLTGAADFGDGVTLPDSGAFVAKYDSAGHAVWARTLDPAGFGFAIAVDPAGATYVTGSGRPEGGSVITLWKVSADGTQQWSRQATGNYLGAGLSIAVDADGNSHVTGALAGGTALFGAGGPIQIPLTDTGGGGQMFVAKYDRSGNLIWAKQSADLVGLAYATGIALDAAGNSYVGGVAKTTVLGLGESNETPIAGDNFVAKYNPLGQLSWAKSIAGQNGEVKGVATGPGGGLFITGYSGAVTFAPGEENETTLLGPPLFVARYNPDGAFEWARRAGPGAGGASIAVDGLSNAIVVGSYAGVSTFGAGEPTETTLTNANLSPSGYFDLFVAKYLNDEITPNRAPVADPQEVIVPEDTPTGIVLTGSDPDGHQLTFSIVTGPAHGTLTGVAPSLTYTPHANYHGPDDFTFGVNDGVLFSNVATVTLAVIPINDVPVAHAQALATALNTPLPIVLTGRDDDGDPLEFPIVTGPSHGLLSGTAPNLTYTPNLNFTGVDLFTFRAYDGLTFSEPATITIDVGLNSLACGTLVSGTIAAAGEVDQYSFAGQAGQIISLAVASTGGFSGSPGSSLSLELTLVSPAGTALGILRSNSQGNFRLPQTGTYVVRLGARNRTTVGSYNVNMECLIPTPAPPAIPLACDGQRSGTVSAAAQVDLYTFAGQAGRIISVALASTGGFSGSPGSSLSVELTLFTPTGIALGLLRSNSQGNFELPDTGTYVLRVSARNLATTGSYNVNLECLIPAPSPPAVPLACGALLPGTLATAAQVDLFTFEGQAGRIISVALASTGGFSGSPGSSLSVELTLFTPTGIALGLLRSNSQGNLQLPDTGTYVLRVSARNLATTGSYNVNLECLIPAPSPPAVPLACGAMLPGTLATAAQVDLFTFEGQAGRIISVALASTGGFSGSPGSSLSVELTLFTPTGIALGLLRSNSQGNFQLPDTGTYVLRVSARNLATTGSYNVNLECLIPPLSPVGPLGCGALQSANIEAAGQIDLYTFEGQAGRIISVALASTGGFSPSPGSSLSVELTLFTPTGIALGLLRSNSQGNFQLPDTGTYVLRVSARNLATTGSYNVNLECLIPAPSPPAVPLACGAPRSGTIGAAGQIDVYTFEGQAGAIVSVALTSTGGFSGSPGSSLSVELTLFTPAGVALGLLRSNSQGNFQLPDTGTFILRVSARNLATTGSYRVALGCS